MRKHWKKENSEVILPKTYVNTPRLENNRYNKSEYVSEYLILKRIRAQEDNYVAMLRDQYGRLIEHKTNSETWNIYDKFPCLKEETFWVYGFNPYSARKTCPWILENLVIEEFKRDKNVVAQVYAYKNKVIFVYDSKRVRFVICKNQSDAIRLYNKLNELSKSKKIRRIYFMGQVTTYSERGKQLIQLLLDLTGWSLSKIRAKST